MTDPSDPRARLTALQAAAVQGAAPFSRTRDAVHRWWEQQSAPPASEVPVYLFALGKAAPAMAAGALAALAERRTPVVGGIVVAAHEPTPSEWHGLPVPEVLQVVQGDHPVPGPRSLAAADAIEDVLQGMEPHAIALVLLSGGTTALCAAPIPTLSQAVGSADAAQAVLANLAQTLLESGLAIHEMNAIRRRVLRFGAGRLATALAARGARAIVTLAISDVIGDDPSVIGSGPCSPDPLDDATFLALLDAHDMRSRLQRAMAQVLGLAGDGAPPAVAPASHEAFARVEYTLVAGNADAVSALATAATANGIDTVQVDPVPLEGEAALLGDVFARRALTLARSLRPGATALLVAGGEPVVHLRDTVERALQAGDEDDARRDAAALSALDADLADAQSLDEALLRHEARRRQQAAADARTTPIADEPLRGGRMQVLALAAALALEGAASRGDRHAWRVLILAAGTDGRDGPTDAAGAIVDAAVPALARRAGRAPEEDLLTGRSWYPLDAAGALLRTGPTGTNVMDVVAVLVRG
jgi:hydroxypyruvate reductase